jgi:hypothetical protein
MKKFAVVEFLKDQTVAIVRESWIENCDEVSRINISLI